MGVLHSDAAPIYALARPGPLCTKKTFSRISNNTTHFSRLFDQDLLQIYKMAPKCLEIKCPGLKCPEAILASWLDLTETAQQ